MKVALITGITGQDGSYLAELLLEKGYKYMESSGDPPLSILTELMGFMIVLVFTMVILLILLT